MPNWGKPRELGVTLLLSARQLVAGRRVRRRNVHVECLQRRAARVADFVYVAALDQDKFARPKRVTLSIDDRLPRTSNDKQPLIGAAMPVVGTAFAVAGSEHHLRRLR